MSEDTKSAAGLIKICAGVILFLGMVITIGCVLIGVLDMMSRNGANAIQYLRTPGLTLIISGVLIGLSNLTIYALLMGFAVIVENSSKAEIVDALFDISDTLKNNKLIKDE